MSDSDPQQPGVPTGWNLVRLRRIGEIVNGGTPTADVVNWDGDIPFVTPPDLRPVVGRVVCSTERTLTPLGAAASSVVPAGSVIMSIRAPIGYVARTDRSVALNQGCRALVPREGVEPRFATYALMAAAPELAANGRGTTFMELSAGQVADVRIPLPTAAVQRSISDFLDREIANIDKLMDEQQLLIELLRERRAQTINERLSRYRISGLRLKHVAEIQTGVTLSGEGDPVDPEWPYLRVANVQTGFVDLSEVKYIRVPEAAAATAMLRRGDVLMTEGGDIDKLGRGASWDGVIEPMLHQNHVFAVRSRGNLDGEFLVYWLDGRLARDYFLTTAKKSTNLASTNRWTLGNLPIPDVPLDEQRRIVAYLDQQTAKIDTLIAETERFIELSKERRAALITAAVTGQIDVRGEAA